MCSGYVQRCCMFGHQVKATCTAAAYLNAKLSTGPRRDPPSPPGTPSELPMSIHAFMCTAKTILQARGECDVLRRPRTCNRAYQLVS
jgi:hypothetical protein